MSGRLSGRVCDLLSIVLTSQVVKLGKFLGRVEDNDIPFSRSDARGEDRIEYD